MRILKLVCILILSHSHGSLHGQDTLSLQQYFQLVKHHHPLSIQAGLIATRGDLALSRARGAFDPVIKSRYQRKNFKDQEYYEIWDSHLEIPTFLNVNFKAGFEQAEGVFLNPERNLPDDGLYYAGISLPLGQGLIHNPRNIALRKSKLEKEDLQWQANLALSNLLLDANNAYWRWYEAYYKLAIIQANLSLIEERFEGIREAVFAGENAAIDSVEALIQVQEWSNRQQNGEVNYRNNLLMLTNFLWADQLDVDFIPIGGPQIALMGLDHYQEQALNNLPQWKMLQLEQAKLHLDKQLSAEQLKPVVNLNYNLLLSSENENAASNFTNDYKGGLELEFPLFLRKERASLKQAKIKLQENQLRQTDLLREVENDIIQHHQRLVVLSQMIENQQQMILNYQRMLTGERIKFSNGESSIFLINSRENQKLTAELRLIELKAEYGRLKALLQWSSGTLVGPGRATDL